jgi:hypothetical protein
MHMADSHNQVRVFVRLISFVGLWRDAGWLLVEAQGLHR